MSFRSGRSVLITFTMAAYALPSLRFNPCVGNGAEWHAGRAHRAVKLGWTSVSRLAPGGAVVVVVRSGTVTVVVDVVVVELSGTVTVVVDVVVVELSGTVTVVVDVVVVALSGTVTVVVAVCVVAVSGAVLVVVAVRGVGSPGAVPVGVGAAC